VAESTQKKSNLVSVGRITTVFGVKGWLKVHSNTEPAESILDYSPWWLKTRHGVKQVEIDEGRPHGNAFVVHIKGLDDRDLARDYCQVDIAVERDQMPELADGEFYWHQLEGLTVISDFEGRAIRLGKVQRLMETGANDVLVIKGDADSVDQDERLVPYIPEQFVKSIDLAAGEIIVDWDPDF
jgi:16S rRNA processing protein RimM